MIMIDVRVKSCTTVVNLWDVENSEAVVGEKVMDVRDNG